MASKLDSFYSGAQSYIDKFYNKNKDTPDENTKFTVQIDKILDGYNLSIPFETIYEIGSDHRHYAIGNAAVANSTDSIAFGRSASAYGNSVALGQMANAYCGNGIMAIGGSTGGYGVDGQGNGSGYGIWASSHAHVIPNDVKPILAQEGDMWIDNANNLIKIYTNGEWKEITYAEIKEKQNEHK